MVILKIAMWKKKEIGRRRSMIRRISSWLPVFPLPKIYIKINVNKKFLIKLENSSELNSSHSKFNDGLNIITTLFDKTTDSFIYMRSDIHDIGIKSMTIQGKKSSPIPFMMPEPRSSTPISFIHNTNITSNHSALIRISQLEDELALLRQQIASIVISQEGSTNKTSSVNTVFSISKSSSLPSPSPPLPPPPPPPPHFPTSTVQPLPLPPAQFHFKNQLDKLKPVEKRKAKAIDIKSNKIDNLSEDHKSVPDMSEILKGINNVKLRHIERSPGGTPLRKPPLQSEPSDPASLLAVALKRRFSKIHPQEQSPEKENQESFEFLSTGNSPISIISTTKTKLFGPHLLKPIKKTKEMKSSPPLAEINE